MKNRTQYFSFFKSFLPGRRIELHGWELNIDNASHVEKNISSIDVSLAAKTVPVQSMTD